MERNAKIQKILQFVSDNPQSQASIAVGRRMIGVGENLRNGENISQLNSVLIMVDDEELDACYYIIS